MEYLDEIKNAHEEIQKKIFFMLPENWEKVCLYASIVEQQNEEITGEMYFYYFPRGILKKRPINVYEVPEKFGIDEKQYLDLADNLYKSIKLLRRICIKNKEKPWSNITIIIENQSFRVIYEYDNLFARRV